VNVVDSSGWLEYFADTPRAKLFAPAIEDTSRLLVPTLAVHEVFQKVRRERGEGNALLTISAMLEGRVIDLDAALAIDAGSLDLPLADSIIYATARRHGATLWTQDDDFAGLPDVRYFPTK
jgi:predicted nucleic acid-binding protein